jgi:hypothetical protein
MSEDDPKIIIDSDWKKEAQQEKQRLAEQEAPAQALPEAHFLELVNMVSMQAVISLGGYKTPDGKIIPPDVQAAKHYIDLLEILFKKTEKNLDDKESTVLSATLHELRLLYIQVASGGAVPPDFTDAESPAGR